MKNWKFYKPVFFKLILLSAGLLFFFISCNNHKDVSEKEIVQKPEDINAKAGEVIQATLKEILQNSSDLPDSFKIKNPQIVQSLYDQNSSQPLWASNGVFIKNADSLFNFIQSSKQYGLFPEDYYYNKLFVLKNQLTDSASQEKRLDASLWAYSDMMMTSAFVQMVKDLKIGRLLPDSLITKDHSLSTVFFWKQLKTYQQSNNNDFANQLEPQNSDYQKMKEALKVFLLKANFRTFTFIGSKDSMQLPKIVYKRLVEEDTSLSNTPTPDSTQFREAIKKYQKSAGLKVDGKISSSLITKLNDNDKEKFIRVAINLDRYKQLQPMPVKYIWVNLPAYYLKLKDSGNVVLTSKVVVGKPTTQTPIITSAISDMITYPQWTIPESIIKKEILPGLKKDPNYTIRKGYSLVDKNGNEVDPNTVDWSKFKNAIPYKVVQGSGDANALGVLKFNFPNPYSVYLHDTNQRYLFSKTSRALSHGCVRVQAWNALAKYILRNDSTYSAKAVPIDSMQKWLATKQKKYIPVRKPIPLFIRYFTCDTNDQGHLVFYEDIYGEDKRIREKIFANK